MTLESLLLLFSSCVIVILLAILIFMYAKIRQLVRDVKELESRLTITDSEIEALVRNFEEIKKLNLK
ncbi:MAG: hypothetical protein NQU46_03405 [Methanolinea sp.]|nr:hypothetical protein [Methanolinea sp.]